MEFLKVATDAVLLRPTGLNGNNLRSINKFSTSEDHAVTNIWLLYCVSIIVRRFGPNDCHIVRKDFELLFLKITEYSNSTCTEKCTEKGHLKCTKKSHIKITHIIQLMKRRPFTSFGLWKKYGKFSNKSIEWLSRISWRRCSEVAASFDSITSMLLAFTTAIFKNSISSWHEVESSFWFPCSPVLSRCSHSSVFRFWDSRFSTDLKYLILLNKYPPPFESQSKS